MVLCLQSGNSMSSLSSIVLWRKCSLSLFPLNCQTRVVFHNHSLGAIHPSELAKTVSLTIMPFWAAYWVGTLMHWLHVKDQNQIFLYILLPEMLLQFIMWCLSSLAEDCMRLGFEMLGHSILAGHCSACLFCSFPCSWPISDDISPWDCIWISDFLRSSGDTYNSSYRSFARHESNCIEKSLFSTIRAILFDRLACKDKPACLPNTGH